MRWTATEKKLTVYPSFVLLVCALLWLDRGYAAASFLISAGLHECGHLLALHLTGVPVCRMELRASGAVLYTAPTSPGKEAVCTVAGPLMNLLLLSVCFRCCPTAALVNLILLVYNLLPIYPLDGGRLLRTALCVLFGEQKAERLSELFSALLTGILVICGVLLTCVFHAGLYPCLIAALLLCRLKNL